MASLRLIALTIRVTLCSITLLALAQELPAQERVVPQSRHAWGAFLPGSWKLVRVTSEQIDAAGKVTTSSTTETKSLLVAADATGYELQVDVQTAVSGKRFNSESRYTRQGYHGEKPGERMMVKPLADESLPLGGKNYRVHTAELEIGDQENRRTTVLRYADSTAPFVLSRRTVAYDRTKQKISDTSTRVVAIDVPDEVLGRRRLTWKTHTVHDYHSGRAVTDEVHSQEVPGGVVSHVSEEFDATGKLVRRSRLELLNYGVATKLTPPPPRRVPRRVRREERRAEERK